MSICASLRTTTGSELYDSAFISWSIYITPTLLWIFGYLPSFSIAKLVYMLLIP